MTRLDDRTQSTQDLIASEPTTITLNRSTWESDGADGRRRSSAPVAQPAKQRFFSGIAADRSIAFNQLGLRKERIYILIGLPDDDIQEGDLFTLPTGNYRVVWVDDDRRYQCKAEVVHAS